MFYFHNSCLILGVLMMLRLGQGNVGHLGKYWLYHCYIVVNLLVNEDLFLGKMCYLYINVNFQALNSIYILIYFNQFKVMESPQYLLILKYLFALSFNLILNFNKIQVDQLLEISLVMVQLIFQLFYFIKVFLILMSFLSLIIIISR